MDTSRLGQGQMIAAISAIALFLIMLIPDWFGNDFGGANAWEAFGVIDLILFLAIVAALGMAVLAMSDARIDLPVSVAVLTFALGALSVLLILYRIIDPPDFGLGPAAEAFGVELEIGRKIGVWLGLIAAGGITYGGWLAMQQEGRSPSRPRDRRDRGGPGGPPPAA